MDTEPGCIGRCGVSNRCIRSCRRSASFDDDLRVFAQRRRVGQFGQLVFEQLRRPADTPERVLDLMRQVADQFAVGLLLLQQALLAAGFQLLVDRPHLDEQTAIGHVDRRHGAIHLQRRTVRLLQFDVLAGVGPAIADRLSSAVCRLWSNAAPPAKAFRAGF